ncbi:MAG: CHASE3 domain-containing protein, partial [Rubrivivax sp.]
MPRFERVWFSRFALPVTLAVALLLLVFSELGFRRTAVTLQERDAVLARRVQVARVQQLLLTAEASQRGYLMTGRPSYREPYVQTLPQLASQLERLEALYADDPALLPEVRKLVELVKRRAAEMVTTADMFAAGKDGWRDLMLTDIGRETMDEAERIVRNVTEVETRRLDEARRVLDETLRNSRVGIATMVSISVLVLLALIGQARRLADERALRMMQLSSERDRLEAEVERRTAEITEIAQHLQNAREDERSRLARELHDELGGLLTAAKLDAARLRNKLGAPPSETHERLAHLVQALDAGIALKRRIIEDLHPSSLANLGLKPALEILCAEFASSSQIAVQAQIDDVPLDKAGALTVYRLVQEALTNTAKHARAAHIEVAVTADETEVAVRISDDGAGFDPTTLKPASHGLSGMRFRVQSA